MNHIDKVEAMEDWEWRNAHEYRASAGCPPEVTKSVWLAFLKDQVVILMRRSYAKLEKAA